MKNDIEQRNNQIAVMGAIIGYVICYYPFSA